MDPQHIRCFPPFRLDLRNEQLWRGKRLLALKPKTFAVLRYLVQHAGQLVTKEALLHALWADVYVSDAVLRVCMREIRAALGDSARAPRFIETVPWRGYRWIATGQSLAQPASPPQPLTSSMVGRTAEMAQLQTWLHTALRGERQIVFVTGEAGIGKTTLVKAFLEQLAGRNDLRLARGQCFEQYGAGEAYLPVLEALGHLCRLPGQAGVVEVLGRYAPTWLLQMPSCLSEAELKVVQRKVQGATKERMLREMAEALEALTLEQALVLWFDDLHWSDYATLDLVSYLARRTPRARLLLIGGYRPVDVLVTEHPLQQVKQDLLVHGQCAELSLACLTEAEVRVYLAARFPRGLQPAMPLHTLAQMIYQRTEGNPLFMVNMVDYVAVQHGLAWRDGQWVMARAGTDMAVPRNLRQFIEQQAARLSPEMQQVLEAASVAGIEFSTAAVAAALVADIASVEKRCAELVRHGQFLCPNGVGT